MTTDTPTLYAISAEHRRILEAIDANGGELPPELEADWDASSGSLRDKLNACHARKVEIGIKRAEAQGIADGIKAEWERALERVKSFDREDDSLTAYIMRNVEASGETKIDTGRVTFRIQTNEPSSEWLGDPDAIPERFRRTITTTTVSFDKKAANKAFKDGEVLPEDIRVTQRKKLVIK